MYITYQSLHNTFTISYVTSFGFVNKPSSDLFLYQDHAARLISVYKIEMSLLYIHHKIHYNKIQAGLILHQGYAPEKRHAKWTKIPTYNSIFSGG